MVQLGLVGSMGLLYVVTDTAGVAAPVAISAVNSSFGKLSKPIFPTLINSILF